MESYIVLPDWKTQYCDDIISSKINLIASVYCNQSLIGIFGRHWQTHSKSYVEKQRNCNCLNTSEKEQSWVTYFRFQDFL